MNGFEIFPFAGFLILAFLISGRILFLKRNGFILSSGSKNTSKVKLLLYPIFLMILLLFLLEMIKPVFQISFSLLPETLTYPLINSLLLKISGVLFIAIALFLLWLTLLHFKNSLRFGLDENSRGELITTGIFSISRNPFFISIDLYFLGVAIFLPNVFFISFFILAMVSIHFFILKEEKFMNKVYGEDYKKYVQKVRRYL